MKHKLLLTLILALAVPTVHAAVNVDFSITPDVQDHTISPLIYGSNQDLVGSENFTLYRLGGNRTTLSIGGTQQGKSGVRGVPGLD